MGTRFSCLDNTRLPTIPDSIVKTCTDGELTEFLANARSVLREEKNNSKEPGFVFFSGMIPKSTEAKKNTKIKFEDNATRPSDGEKYYKRINSPLQKRRSSFAKPNRIYSSNVTESSFNIIDRINSSHSICSTNVNSSSNSRCVSPIFRKANY
jgi:hypothetical protein